MFTAFLAIEDVSYGSRVASRAQTKGLQRGFHPELTPVVACCRFCAMFGVGQNLFYQGQCNPSANWGMQGNWFFPLHSNVYDGQHVQGGAETATVPMQMSSPSMQPLHHTGFQPAHMTPMPNPPGVPDASQASTTVPLQMSNPSFQPMHHTGCQPTQPPMPSHSGFPDASQTPSQPHASRVQQAVDMLLLLSEAERTEVLKAMPCATEKAGDFDSTVRCLINSVVSLDHLDENDLRVVADSLIDSLGRVCQGVDLHPFITQSMHHGIEEGRADPTKIADAVLLHNTLNALLWKAPSHLNPDDIQRMDRGSPDKIAKCLAINKLMIQRIVELQPTESRKFWIREGAKPIATSSNERDFFFGVVPKLNLQVAKPVVQECVAWIATNVPQQYKKGQHEAPEKRKAPTVSEHASSEPASKLPKRVDFDFGAYTLDKFEHDASALPRSLPGTTLLSVKEASKEQPIDSSSPLHAVAVKFDTALEKLGVEGQIRESVYGTFKLATQNIGLKCDKRQVHELRRWVARALAMKHDADE
ncbi:unnamed protein product [Symbiodinium natans]|uniref:Uncharacterized protein n=1 Tax=Symbiodinium natans TaxID=878477 RepID=A0A812IG85_9DINO|nr:unnamed protein product [Symbiodinium natans]CAE7489424.1 unnamed protein product [Symbiodinium natans]